MSKNMIMQKLSRGVQVFSNYLDLSKFYNLHQGKECFIIGNGPSLKKTDLTKLKDKYTFGLNRIYLNYENMGYEPTYLVSINDLVLEQFKNDFKKLKSIKFFSDRQKGVFKDHVNTHYIHLLNDPYFHKYPYKGLWTGHTVTYIAMQLAYFMGFKTVYLVGVDHSFKSEGNPNQTQKLNHDDPNHFSPDYFKGYNWQLPDLDMSEKAYKLAKKAFESDGRQILDATLGGKLRVFKKTKYQDLFK